MLRETWPRGVDGGISAAYLVGGTSTERAYGDGREAQLHKKWISNEISFLVGWHFLMIRYHDGRVSEINKIILKQIHYLTWNTTITQRKYYANAHIEYPSMKSFTASFDFGLL